MVLWYTILFFTYHQIIRWFYAFWIRTVFENRLKMSHIDFQIQNYGVFYLYGKYFRQK